MYFFLQVLTGSHVLVYMLYYQLQRNGGKVITKCIPSSKKTKSGIRKNLKLLIKDMCEACSRNEWVRVRISYN